MLSRGVSRFSIDFLGLTALTICVGNHSNVPEKFGFRNFQCMRTENHVLQTNFIVSEYAKNSWEPLLSFRLFGISKTFMHITVFLQFFCLTVPKNFVRNQLMFQKVSNVRYWKNLCNWTECHGFPSKIFHLRVPKDFVVEHFGISEKFGYRKKFMPKRLISLFSVDFFFT